MITNRASPHPRRSDGHINVILALPVHTRAVLLSLTEPKVDSATFNNWLRRGFLDLETQIPVGDAAMLRRIADDLEANREQGVHRRYTGGDVLKVQVLTALSQSGIPFKHAPAINQMILRRALHLLQTGQKPSSQGVLITGKALPVLADRDHLDSVAGDWFAFIHLDRIIGRFIEAFDT